MSDPKQNPANESTPRRASSSLEIQLGRASSILAAVAGALTLITTLYLVRGKLDLKLDLKPAILTSLETVLTEQRAVVETQLTLLKKEISAVRSEMAKLTALPQEAKIASQLERTNSAITAVDGRLTKLETVILNDPAKSLEMPLLRNELEHVKKGYQSDLISLKEEMGRIYDLTKWFLGLMFTIALGIIGLAVTNFVKPGAKAGN